MKSAAFNCHAPSFFYSIPNLSMNHSPVNKVLDMMTNGLAEKNKIYSLTGRP